MGAVAWRLQLWQLRSPQALHAFLDRLGDRADLAFVGLYLLATATLFPRNVLTVAAGLAFGPLRGTVLTWLAGLLAESAIFLGVRYGVADWLNPRLPPALRTWEERLARNGFRAVLLARMALVLPSNGTSALAALTPMSYWAFAGGTALGVLPGTVAYAVFGAGLWHPGSPLFVGGLIGMGTLTVGSLLGLRALVTAERAGSGRIAP